MSEADDNNGKTFKPMEVVEGGGTRDKFLRIFDFNGGTIQNLIRNNLLLVSISFVLLAYTENFKNNSTGILVSSFIFLMLAILTLLFILGGILWNFRRSRNWTTYEHGISAWYYLIFCFILCIAQIIIFANIYDHVEKQRRKQKKNE